MIVREGTATSPGYAIGNASMHKQSPIVITKIYSSNKELEIKELDEAILRSKEELLHLKEISKQTLKEEELFIFDSHISMLNDSYFLQEVYDKINEGFSAAYGYKLITEKYLANFRLMKDEYLKERATDLEEIYKRVISKLLKYEEENVDNNYENSILVVNDLVVSNVVGLDKNKYQGIVAKRGSQVSHAAIIARTLGIPTLFGVNLKNIKEGDMLIIDGVQGKLIVNPTLSINEKYQKLYNDFKNETKELEKYRYLNTETKDGHKIEIGININEIEDLKYIDSAELIGLYRTEFLYMKSTKMPTENEQVEIYKEVLESMPNSKVVIRTLDIGGDKKLSYLRQKKEANPFLGNRGIRLTLNHKLLFKNQIKALLKANQNGNLHILLPMVTTREEIVKAIAIIEDAKKALIKENVKINDYKLGIMIEVPIIAYGVEKVIDLIDFVSIGSNDLLQYLFAADRLNDQINYLYQPYHPEFLQLLKNISDVCHRYDKRISVCGEIAADLYSSILLIGLGIDSLSMNYNSILRVRALINKYNYTKIKKITNKALSLKTNEEVYNLIKKEFFEVR